jgi:hypothetical protein
MPEVVSYCAKRTSTPKAERCWLFCPPCYTRGRPGLAEKDPLDGINERPRLLPHLEIFECHHRFHLPSSIFHPPSSIFDLRSSIDSAPLR